MYQLYYDFLAGTHHSKAVLAYNTPTSPNTYTQKITDKPTPPQSQSPPLGYHPCASCFTQETNTRAAPRTKVYIYSEEAKHFVRETART